MPTLGSGGVAPLPPSLSPPPPRVPPGFPFPFPLPPQAKSVAPLFGALLCARGVLLGQGQGAGGSCRRSGLSGSVGAAPLAPLGRRLRSLPCWHYAPAPPTAPPALLGCPTPSSLRSFRWLPPPDPCALMGSLRSPSARKGWAFPMMIWRLRADPVILPGSARLPFLDGCCRCQGRSPFGALHL